MQRAFVIFLIIVGVGVGSPAQTDEDCLQSPFRNVDIIASYAEDGEVSRIVVRPFIRGKQQVGDSIALPCVDKIMDVLVPETIRGRRVGTRRSNLGRASGQIVIYDRVVISWTLVCRHDTCGVTYAEVTPRKNE
jgi:hypothetical protein